MSSFRTRGPICWLAGQYEMDEGTLALTASPAPGTIDAETAPPAVPSDRVASEEDVAEFRILRDQVGVFDNQARDLDDAGAYLAFRRDFFGSDGAYQVAAAAADTELEDTRWQSGKRTIRLKQLVPFSRRPDAQKIVYRWVRRTYKDLLGETFDVPLAIQMGMTVRLLNSPKAVDLDDERTFPEIGFSPLPIKVQGHYCLGTLADAATVTGMEEKPDPRMATAQQRKFAIGVSGEGTLRDMLFTEGGEFYRSATWYDQTAAAQAFRQAEVDLVKKAGYDVPGQLEWAKRTEKNIKQPPRMDVTVVFARGARGETVTIKGPRGTKAVVYDLERDQANFVGDDPQFVLDRHIRAMLSAIAHVV